MACAHFFILFVVSTYRVQAVLGRLFRVDKARQAVFERVLILFSMTRSLEDDGQSTAGKSEM